MNFIAFDILPSHQEVLEHILIFVSRSCSNNNKGLGASINNHTLVRMVFSNGDGQKTQGSSDAAVWH